MGDNAVMVKGDVIVEGTKFPWWLTDGVPPRLTVSHAVFGTRTVALGPSPADQAKEVARAMLADARAAKAARPPHRSPRSSRRS